jgi:Fe-S cluster assembly protein SufD
MTETPIVVTRTRRGEASQRSFAFRASQIPASPTGALQTYRQQAWDAFQRLPLPLTTDEAWRRTDLRGLQVESFRLPEAGAYQTLLPVPDSLLEPVADGTHGGQVLLYPGGARVNLDPALAQKGVVFMDLASAEAQHAPLLERLLGQVVKPEEGKFAALAAALGSSGVLLYVPRGVQIEQPLHSLVWGPGVGLAHLTHVLVWLEEGAAATFVHEYASADEDGGQTLHCGIVEVHVGEGANLRFVELQSWGRHVWNFTQERVVVDRGGQLDWVFGAIGSRLTKNFSDLNLVGSGAVGRMSGFYFTDGEQHLDHDTQQNHLAAHTTSDLLFKGALEDASRSVWQGMIYVAPEAQKTDGYQANRNLVLNRAARADSIPGLEILADDVRCTHGATVGKIDQDQVFYLRSRGIPDEDARRLIVEGFFDPIMQRIPFEGVRQRFQAAIQHKMKQANGPESV